MLQFRHSIVIIGPLNAGKTALLRRLTGIKKYKEIPRTIGVDISKIDVQMGDKIAQFEVHDSQGSNVLYPLIKPTIKCRRIDTIGWVNGWIDGWMDRRMDG